MKVGLYSAIYGASDWVKPMRDIGVPCVMYTDNPNLVAPGWEVRVVPHNVATLNGEPRITNPMLNHKYWKCHPEVAMPGYDVSLWLDGSMELLIDDYVDHCLSALGSDDWACVPHPERRCIYTEADLSASLTWRYDAQSIKDQASYYRSVVGHPVNYGLVASGANARRHTPEVIELGQHWWYENITRSHQDQISLPVLFRLFEGKVTWNQNLPWHTTWTLHGHSPHRPV